MKYKLVKFKDGRYGARKGFFIYTYLDLSYPSRGSWTLYKFVDKYCKGTEAQAREAIAANIFDKGTLV